MTKSCKAFRHKPFRGRDMPTIRLYGGECDGLGQKVPFTERPDIFYAVPLLVMEEIKKSAISALQKQVATDKARRLAYKFEKIRAVDKELEYCYRRCAEKDKPEVVIP
jgi:hypothetical protein